MKLNVYEYTIKDGKVGEYTGSYTVKAGCVKEKELQKKFKSKLVDSFEHNYIPAKQFEVEALKQCLKH